MMMREPCAKKAKHCAKEATISFHCDLCERTGQSIQRLTEDAADVLCMYSVYGSVLCGRCCVNYQCVRCHAIDVKVTPICDEAHRYCEGCLEGWPRVFYQGEVSYCYLCFPVGLYGGDAFGEQRLLVKRALPSPLSRHGDEILHIVCDYSIDECYSYAELSPWDPSSSPSYSPTEPDYGQ